MSFEPIDPGYEERVRASFARQPFMAHIGAQLSEVGPGFCEIRVPYAPELTQQHDFIHGGVGGTIADDAGGYAAYTLMPADSTVLTVEYKLNLLAPGKGDVVIARANVIRPGRTLTVCTAEVTALIGDSSNLCATALMTIMRLDGKPDAAD